MALVMIPPTRFHGRKLVTTSVMVTLLKMSPRRRRSVTMVALPAAFGLTRLIRAQLYGVTPNDPWTMAVATICLMPVACAAGYIPALRASRVDPIRALRYE